MLQTGSVTVCFTKSSLMLLLRFCAHCQCSLCVVQTDPTRFLSGSDDGTVRLWSIADESAVACIDSKANVCSVQFSPTNSNLMAFGSANYRVYLYDLRQVSGCFCPLQTESCVSASCIK